MPFGSFELAPRSAQRKAIGRIGVVLAAMLAAGPALAASTPEGLVEELNMAANGGKEAAFLSALSAGTRRAITQVNAAQSRLGLAERDLVGALQRQGFWSLPIALLRAGPGGHHQRRPSC